jgi:hypothetical protein
MKKIIVLASVLILAFIILAVFPMSTGNKYKSIEGKVTDVSIGGVGDAVMKLDGHNRSYYINRGYETFEAAELKSLIGKQAKIIYTDGWTPLDPFGHRSLPIESVYVEDNVFFPKPIDGK